MMGARKGRRRRKEGEWMKGGRGESGRDEGSN